MVLTQLCLMPTVDSRFSRRPFYSGTIGTAWLDNGGVFVLANIRGGGEFGPKWHQAGLKEKEDKTFLMIFIQ